MHCSLVSMVLLLPWVIHAAASSPPPSVTLRVRLPSGQTKRVVAGEGETIADVAARALSGAPVMGKSAPSGAPSVFFDRACTDAVEGSADVRSLGLENGAMLYCPAAPKTSPPRSSAASSGMKAAARACAVDASEVPGAAASHSRADVFASRPKRRPGQGASGAAAEGPSLIRRIVPQKRPNCTSLSMESGAAQQLAAYLASAERAPGERGIGWRTSPRRCQLSSPLKGAPHALRRALSAR